MQRARVGESRAFSELVARHQGVVFRVCYRVLGNRQDAEDAAQESFVRAYERLDGFEGRSSFKTWLTKLAVNTSLNELAKRKRALREIPPEAITANAGDDPEERLVSSEAVGRVREALLEVKENHRAAVVLKDLEGYSFAEVGEMLEVSEATARVWAHRGRKKLKETLT
nr:RNA polymerase sigma factor [Rubrobacter indicoceani]